MKASRIIYLSAAMLLLAGCSAEQTSEQDGALLPIVLGSTVADAPLTRAANDLNNTYLTAGQQVTVRISPTGENNYTDYTYTTAASDVMTPPAENKPYYPMTGNVDIRAYHPASAATGSSAATFSVAENQTENDAYIASDLLWAATDDSDNALDNLAKTASTRTLKFQHKLSKITVNATPDGVQVTSITSITLNNVKRKVTFNPSTGATALAATDNDPTTVTMSNNGSAVIPAQDISGTFITINTDAGSALYTLSTTFESGHQYTFNIAVNGAAIGTTNTITDWDTTVPAVNAGQSIAVPPTGGLPGLFTINAAGDKVFFSKGNLQYQASTGTWRFAEHQYDYVGNGTKGNVTGSDNAQISSTYDGWIDLFGWGTSGYQFASGYGTAYQPWSTSTANEHYGPTDGTSGLTGTYANADWGVYNAISNGGNSAGLWRTLTRAEWTYVFDTRSTTSGVRYAKATVNGVSGVILLPDDWSTSYYSLASTNTGEAAYNTNSISSSDWSSKFEAHGAVFLPAAGYRNGTTVYLAGSDGSYWSTTATDGTDPSYCVKFSSSNFFHFTTSDRSRGFSVRLVRVAP